MKLFHLVGLAVNRLLIFHKIEVKPLFFCVASEIKFFFYFLEYDKYVMLAHVNLTYMLDSASVH